MVLTSGNDVPRLAQQLSLSPQEKIRLVLKNASERFYRVKNFLLGGGCGERDIFCCFRQRQKRAIAHR